MIKLIREHLSTKIFIITVCLLITVGSAIYGMVALGMLRSYFLELDRSLSNQTEKMVLQLSNTSVQEIDGILKMFALEHGISIVLKDSDEKVLGIYGDMEYSLAPGTDVEDILLGSGITESYSCKLTNGKTYWIQVFGNKEKVNIGLESLKRILPMLGAITFLAALAIAALYTKYITRSILKVSEVSKKMANLDFRVRYTEDRRDEIGILGENLNELSEKLESALDELKEKNTDLEKSIKLEQQLEQQQMAFFSAVSHELKTPITILKGQIQGMLLEVGGYKDRDRYLKRSFEVANSMENMVQEILYVSKIRTSGFELKLIDIPLEKLENVKAVNRVAEVQLYPMDFKIITKSESVDADNQKLRIMAYDSLEDDGPFADGQIHLTKGKYPRKEGEIVVNQFLAEVNQWEIGETVCFKSHSGEQSQASISGIYISGIEEKQGKEPLAVNRIENTIYGKPEFVCHLQETCGYENLIVYVDNPEQLSRTQLEVTRILKNYRVMKADNLFQKMEIPLLQVVRVVKMMLGLSVVSSVLVITLLLSMWMRARKKEIAIYVSLGKTKVDLFMQIILECFSVFGFSTIIALYTGDKMLIVLEKFLDWKSIGAFTSMQIYAQNKDICYLILSGTIILLLSISISLFPILCTKPKKILAEMEG